MMGESFIVYIFILYLFVCWYVGMSVFINDELFELDFENLVFLYFLYFYYLYEFCICTILDFIFFNSKWIFIFSFR